MQKLFVTIIIMTFLISTVAAGTAAGLLYLDREEQMSKQVELTAEIQNLKDKNVDLEARLANADGDDGTDLDCYSQSTDGWLVLNTPCQGQALTPTISVTGVAFGFFESNIVYKLMDGETEIDRGNITYTAPDLGIPGVLNETISLDIPATFDAIDPKLVFFEQSAEDGSDLHIVEIDLE